MKKAVVALSVAMAMAGMNANAGTVFKNENGDYLKVYGGAEIGGTYVADKDKGAFRSNKTYVDDSFATIGLKGKTGSYFAKFELDAERTDWTEENNFQLVMDKIYFGYEIAPKHTLEFGRTDTAYDHYDGFGDYTADLAMSVSEAGDQDNTIKYRGQFGNVKLGVSYSGEGWDAEFKSVEAELTAGNEVDINEGYVTDSREGKVVNGYLGYFGDTFTVIGGAETVDDRGDIFSLHAEVKFDDLSVAGIVSKSDKEKEDDDSMLYLLSAKYKFKPTLAGYIVANQLDHDVDSKDDEYVTVGTEYKAAKNVKIKTEVAMGGDKGTLGYVKAYYWF